MNTDALLLNYSHLEQPYKRYISNKVEIKLRNYVSLKGLKTIDTDKETAIEMCLLFLSNLSNSFYLEVEYKRLSSKILDNTFSKNKKGESIYTLIRQFLIDEKIIEVNFGYVVGAYSQGYKMAEAYLNKGVKNYEFKTQKVKSILLKNWLDKLKAAINDPICNSQLNAYTAVTLPSEAILLKAAKTLVKQGYTNTKGKKLIFKGRKSLKDIDTTKFSIVEADIELYKRLFLKNGFIIPTSSDNAGGRVVTSFTLCPSWIRNEILLDNKKIVQNDYSCLHPNIAQSLYNFEPQSITHQILAEFLGITKQEVKIEHLSFFNKTEYLMKQSSLFEFYYNNFTEMTELILNIKKEKGYKEVTRQLFKRETELMQKNIVELEEENIKIIYVYDCLYSTKQNQKTVRKIMNYNAAELNILSVSA